MVFSKKKRSKKRILSETLLSLLVITGIAGFVIVRSTQGATYTWDGEGTTNDWSECANWTTNTCPGASDIAQFNGTSTKDATIDASFTGSVQGVTIASGYTGIITAARSLTVGSSGFSQAAGTWNGADQTLTVASNGAFTVSNGTHNATTGTWQVERNVTYSGGTLNATTSTLTLTSDNFSDSTTFTCTGIFPGQVQSQKDDTSSTSETTITIGSGCNVTFVTNFTSESSIVINGTLNATNITIDSDFTQNGTLYMTGTLTLNSNYFADHSVLSCSGTFPAPIDITKTDESSGTTTSVTIESGCTATLASDLSYNGELIINGKLIGSNISIENDLTVGASGNLILSGTLTFTSNSYLDTSTLTCTGPIGPPVNITKDSESVGTTANFILSSGCEITLVSDVTTGGDITNNGTILGNNLTTYSSFTNAGTLQLSGTLTLGGTGTYDLALVDCTGGNFVSGNVVLNKTNSNPYMRLESNCTFPGSFTRTDGTIADSTSPYTLTVLGDFSMSTTDAFGGANLTLAFGGPDDQTITQNASSFSSPVVINKTAGRVTQATAVTINSTGQNMTITDGEYSNGAFTLSVNNVLTVGGGELYQGTGNISAAGYTINDGGTWINNSTGDISVGASGVTNNGVMAFGNPASCGGTDNIAITSSSGGSQRAWSGTGGFQMYDVSVTDQGGSSAITAFSSTEGTGVGTNWDIQTNCPVTAPRLGNNSRLKGGVRLD